MKVKSIGLIVLLLILATATASAQSVLLQPSTSSPKVNDTFTVDVVVKNAGSIMAMTADVVNTSNVDYIGVEKYPDGWIKLSDNPIRVFTMDSSKAIDTTNGATILTLKFKALSEGNATINLSNITVKDTNGNSITIPPSSLTVNITTTTSTTPTPTPTANIVKFDYGAVIKVNILNVPDTTKDTIIRVVSATTGETVKSATVHGTGVAEISGLDPGTYYLVITNDGVKMDTSDPTTWTSVSYGTDFVELKNTANNMDIKVEGASNVEWIGNMPVYIQVKTARPVVEISLKNPRTPVVVGDMLVFKVKVSGVSGSYDVNYSLSGPYDESSLAGAISPGITARLIAGKEYEVKIDTTKLKNVSAGKYSFEVDVLSGNSIIAKKSIDLELVRPTVTAEVPSKVVLYSSIKVKGTTNVAETNSEYDAGTPNKVLVYVFTPNGTLIRYNSTSGNYELSPYKRSDINVETNADLNKTTTTADVMSDGTWEVLKDVKANYGTGSYEVDVVVVTDLTKINDPNFRGKATYYVIVEKPKISIELDRLVYAPGQSIIIKGTTNLGDGYKIKIELSDPNLLVYDTVSKRLVGSTITVYTDSDGNWQTSKFYINPDAEYKSYTITAEIVAYPSATDVATITVRKVAVEATLSVTKVTRNEEVILSGKAPTDTVFLFTDEKDVFENVGKMPATEKGTLSTLEPEYQPMVIKTSNGEFKVTLTVSKTADEGSYVLYVVASPDGRSFDLSKDPYTMISVIVLPIGVVKYPSEIKMVRGSEERVFIKVNAEPDSDIFVCYTLEGHGVKVTKAATPTSSGVSFGHNNKFSKWNESENNTWWMYVDLYPYYDIENHMLTDTWTCDKKDTVKLLPTGVYKFGIHVYTRDPDSGIFTETSEVTIPLIVEPVKLTVEVPTTVKKGDNLVIKIKENRKVTTSYDYIYVVLDTGTKLRKFTHVSLDKNGTATVLMPTADLDPGEYKLYVRDTMGTECGNINDYYNIPPTDSYAKNYSADDDALWVGTVKIVEAAAVTTTVPPTTTVTTTTVTTTTVPTTTTVAPTTTVAKTTTVVTTPPPTTTKKTPGFEAIFAIAGLLAITYLLRRRQ